MVVHSFTAPVIAEHCSAHRARSAECGDSGAGLHDRKMRHD